jgi:hypothetical protein
VYALPSLQYGVQGDKQDVLHGLMARSGCVFRRHLVAIRSGRLMKHRAAGCGVFLIPRKRIKINPNPEWKGRPMSNNPERQSQPPLRTPAPPTSATGIVSLVMGFLGWVSIPLIGGIVAVIAGHITRKEIRESEGSISGDGLAVTGLVLGYANIVFYVLSGFYRPLLLRIRHSLFR